MTLPIGGMKKNNGFSLVEIMLVIIITGIILALAAPHFSGGYTRLQLNKTADDLLNLSRWAQAMAIGQEHTYAVAFTEDRRSYNLEQEINESSDDEDNFKPVKGSFGHEHVIPDAIKLEIKDDRIEFHPDGTIDPVLIQLNSSDKKITLSSKEVRGMMVRMNNE